jgi:hypothetical protein
MVAWGEIDIEENGTVQKNTPQKRPAPHFGVGDDVAYAMGRGLRYGRVVRVIGADEQAAVEIEFEDGGREVHKARDRALSLLRRASGASAKQEETESRKRLSDPDIEAARRSDQRRRW